MLQRRIWVAMAVVAVALGAAGYAAAQNADATSVAREVERQEFPFDDVTYEWQIKLIEGGTTTREMALKVYTLGSDKILVRITAPGEVAGMGILQLGARVMYIFNPEDESVRLIAASARGQGLLGTDYAPADAGLTGLSTDYAATLLSSTDTMYRMEFVPNSDDVSPYSKLVVEYDRTHHKATKIECYEDGVLAKTIVRDQFETRDGVEHFQRLRVINNQSDRVTELRLRSWEVNTGLAASMFTKRTLMLGE
jgi:hypothetical protein